MILQVDKKCFQNLTKGEHNIKIGFTDGEAEGSFRVEDSITFYMHSDEQIPFTATNGMTWGDWIKSFGTGSSGNYIIWVEFDNNSLYIDPRCNLQEFKDVGYTNYDLGASSLRLKNMDTEEYQTINNLIIPNATYGCNICCFDAGTQILMANNTFKNIEDVNIGDKIISYNEITQNFEEDTIINTIIKENSDDLVYVKLSNGIEIGMRAYHPLLTLEGWKSLRPLAAETIKDLSKVSQLSIGDTLIGIDENPTIRAIIDRDTPINHTTYNLTVSKNHNYIANGVVVHNGCK